MRTILELIRIIFLFAIVGAILGNFVQSIYSEFDTDTDRYGWMVFVAIFFLIFVLYRNKLQFSGWYKGKGREKLPKIVTKILIFSSISLLLLPPVLSYVFN